MSWRRGAQRCYHLKMVPSASSPKLPSRSGDLDPVFRRRLRADPSLLAKVNEAYKLMQISRRIRFLLVGSLFAMGCQKQRVPPSAPPTVSSATGQATCQVRSSDTRPLLVEWAAADRAALEARARQGLVAVRYSGCDLEVLYSCRINSSSNGSYSYVELTRKHEEIAIRNADDLYAKIPVGAPSLEAEFSRGNQLVLDLTIAGRYETSPDIEIEDLKGQCESATHVITGITVGAFSLATISTREASAQASFGSAGAGGGMERERRSLREDGESESCTQYAEYGPPEGCGALLRIETRPLGRATVAALPVSDSHPTQRWMPEPEGKPQWLRLRNAGLITVGLGSATAVTMLGLFGAGLHLHLKSSDAYNIAGNLPPDAVKDLHKRDALVRTGIAMSGATVLFAVSSAVLLVKSDRLRGVQGVSIGASREGVVFGARFHF